MYNLSEFDNKAAHEDDTWNMLLDFGEKTFLDPFGTVFFFVLTGFFAYVLLNVSSIVSVYDLPNIIFWNQKYC